MPIFHDSVYDSGNTHLEGNVPMTTLGIQLQYNFWVACSDTHYRV